ARVADDAHDSEPGIRHRVIRRDSISLGETLPDRILAREDAIDERLVHDHELPIIRIAGNKGTPSQYWHTDRLEVSGTRGSLARVRRGLARRERTALDLQIDPPKRLSERQRADGHRRDIGKPRDLIAHRREERLRSLTRSTNEAHLGSCLDIHFERE